MNNNANISKTEKIKITGKGINETVELNGLMIKKMTLFMDELSTLKFTSNSKDFITNYYYFGKVDELDNTKKDITISIDGKLSKGKTATLKIDTSKLDAKEGIFDIILPYSLRISSITDTNKEGMYIIKNNSLDSLRIAINKNYKSKEISIPLYIVSDGNYEMEPIVFNSAGEYHISNSLTLDIK